MADRTQKKFALIVNGATEPWHLENVNRAIRALRAEARYDISVVSPVRPRQRADHYLAPTPESLETLIEGIARRIDGNDMLVVYLTGHGTNNAEKGESIALPGQLYSIEQLRARLEAVRYGRRMVVMDLCESGGSLPNFANEQTDVVTQGSKGEIVSCPQWAPFFWGDQVPDRDRNGLITLDERFAYAVLAGKTPTLPQFYQPGLPTAFSGKVDTTPPFRPEVIEVHDGTGLKAQLAGLSPGQLALVTFSADWCGPCQSYKPTFDQLARRYAGRFLMIRAEGVDGSEAEFREIYPALSAFPTVAFIDYRGRVHEIPPNKRSRPIELLAEAVYTDEATRLKAFIERVRRGDDTERSLATRAILYLEDRPAAIRAVIETLYDPDPEATASAEFILQKMGPDLVPFVGDLLQTFHRGHFHAARSALSLIEKLGPAARAAIPSLTAIAEGQFPVQFAEPDAPLMVLRRRAIGALASVGREDPAVVTWFLKRLADPERSKDIFSYLLNAFLENKLETGREVESVELLVRLASSGIDVAEFEATRVLDNRVQTSATVRATLASIAGSRERPLEVRREAAQTLQRAQFRGVFLEDLGPLMAAAQDATADWNFRLTVANILQGSRNPDAALVGQRTLDDYASATLGDYIARLEPSVTIEPPAEEVPSLREWTVGLGFRAHRGRRFSTGGDLHAGGRIGFWGASLRVGFQRPEETSAEPTDDRVFDFSLEQRLHLARRPEIWDPYLVLPEVGLRQLMASESWQFSFVPIGIGIQVLMGDHAALFAGVNYRWDLGLEAETPDDKGGEYVTGLNVRW